MKESFFKWIIQNSVAKWMFKWTERSDSNYLYIITRHSRSQSYTHWHVSTPVYEWWHLADCKLSQFIWQQKISFVNKCVNVTSFATENQQMELVVCHSLVPKRLNYSFLMMHNFNLDRYNTYISFIEMEVKYYLEI